MSSASPRRRASSTCRSNRPPHRRRPVRRARGARRGSPRLRRATGDWRTIVSDPQIDLVDTTAPNVRCDPWTDRVLNVEGKGPSKQGRGGERRPGTGRGHARTWHRQPPMAHKLSGGTIDRAAWAVVSSVSYLFTSGGMAMTRIAVIGAGIAGVTTAYALSERGYDVTVFDQQRYAGMETSFANGGQLSASNAEVWNKASTVWQGMRWMLRRDAPLLMNPTPSWHKYSWMAEFVRHIPDYRQNTSKRCASRLRPAAICSRWPSGRTSTSIFNAVESFTSTATRPASIRPRR